MGRNDPRRSTNGADFPILLRFQKGKRNIGKGALEKAHWKRNMESGLIFLSSRFHRLQTRVLGLKGAKVRILKNSRFLAANPQKMKRAPSFFVGFRPIPQTRNTGYDGAYFLRRMPSGDKSTKNEGVAQFSTRSTKPKLAR